MSTFSRDRADRSKNLVGFHVGEVSYAVDIFRVREIINPLPLVDLPHAPPTIRGVADHRGAVVPIVDLRVRFGLGASERTRRTKWIVVEHGGHAVGLVVDGVSEVFGAGPGEERDVPEIQAGERERGIAAVFRHRDELVFVLDVDRVADEASGVSLPSLGGRP